MPIRMNSRFVLTGKMSRTRSVVSRDIANAGGLVEASVTYDTDYLVATSDARRNRTLKLRKAEAYGIRIIDEAELYAMLRPSPWQPTTAVPAREQKSGLDLSSFFED